MQINSVTELEDLNNSVNWQNFEKLVARIFEENGYDADSEMLMLRKTKRQFDVIARNKQKTFLVECKRWKNMCQSSIKNAVKQHLERCKRYNRQYPEEVVFPVMIIPTNGPLEFHKNVPVIPILSLDWYLNSPESF